MSDGVFKAPLPVARPKMTIAPLGSASSGTASAPPAVGANLAPVVAPMSVLTGVKPSRASQGVGPSWSSQGTGLMLPPALPPPKPAADSAPAGPSSAAASAAAPDPAAAPLELKYKEPVWSPRKAIFPWYLEVVKAGSLVEKKDLSQKGALLVGRIPICDVDLEHPTISRQHAIIQHRSNGNIYLYDLGSTHGSFVNKKRVKPNVYVQLKNGDVLKFGESTRVFLLCGGPADQVEEDLVKAAAAQAAAAGPAAALAAASAAQEKAAGNGTDGNTTTEQDEAAKKQKELFVGNLTEFKNFMKTQRSKSNKSKEAKKIKKALPELARKVHGTESDSDSDLDKGAEVKSDEELPEDLELTNRRTLAEEVYDSGDEDDEFFDRTKPSGGASRKPSGPKRKRKPATEDGDEDESDESSEEESPAAKKKAAALSLAQMERLKQQAESDRERLLFDLDGLKAARHEREAELAAKASEVDALESFMQQQVSASLEGDRIRAVQAKLQAAEAEIERLSGLIALAQPALQPQKPAPAAAQPLAQKSEFAVPARPASAARSAAPSVAAAAASTPDGPSPAAAAAAAPSAAGTFARPAANGGTARPTAGPRKEGGLASLVGMFEAKQEPDGGAKTSAGDEIRSIDPDTLAKMDKRGGKRLTPEDILAAAAATAGDATAPAQDDPEHFVDWAPPANQSGDGRTHLNARFGY